MATTDRAVGRLTRLGHSIKPSLTMWQNCIQSYAPNNLNLGRTQDIAYNEFGDPFRLLLLRGVMNKEAAINGLMNRTPFTATAPIDHVLFRQCLALGGRCYSYFGHKQTDYRTLLPGAEPMAWHHRELGPFYGMVARVQSHLEGARPVTSIGVVFSEATRYRRPDYSREAYCDVLQKLTEAYLRRSLPLEFVNCLDLCDPRKDLARFKALVVPLSSGLSAEELDALRRYAREGGSLIVGGEALRHDAKGRELADFALADEMGVQFQGLSEQKNRPWTAHGQLGERLVRADGKALVRVRALGGQTLVRAGQGGQNWPLVHVRPFGKGRVVYLASLDCVDLSQQVIDHFAGPLPVAVEPADRRVILTRQERARRWVLHLLDDGPCTVTIHGALASPVKAVAQYPASGWSYELRATPAGLRIVLAGDARDRLLVLE